MHDFIELLQQVTVVLTSIVTLASSVTAVTDTPAEDGFTQKLYKVLEFFALVTEKTKQK